MSYADIVQEKLQILRNNERIVDLYQGYAKLLKQLDKVWTIIKCQRDSVELLHESSILSAYIQHIMEETCILSPQNIGTSDNNRLKNAVMEFCQKILTGPTAPPIQRGGENRLAPILDREEILNLLVKIDE